MPNQSMISPDGDRPAIRMAQLLETLAQTTEEQQWQLLPELERLLAGLNGTERSRQGPEGHYASPAAEEGGQPQYDGELFERLFSQSPNGLLVVNERGEIILTNRRLVEMFDYTINELTGQPVEVLVPETDRERHTRLVNRFMKSPRHRPMGSPLSLAARHRDGTIIPVDINLGPVETGQGKFVIATVRDITERTQMEAELAEVQRRLLDSTEAERLKLARDLHDGPMQDLYSISFQLQSLQAAFPEADPERIREIQSMIEKVTGNLRELTGELRPPALTPFGLGRAICSHVEKLRQQYPNTNFHFELAEDHKSLPEKVRTVLYRVFHQAVANALRHGLPADIWIVFQLEPESAYLEIRDNGRGFNVPARWVELVRDGHYGIVGLVERAESIGGTLKVESTPGIGTQVSVRIPRRGEDQIAAKRGLQPR